MADKRVRMDKDALESLLFKLFERKASENQYDTFDMRMRRKRCVAIYNLCSGVSNEHWLRAV